MRFFARVILEFAGSIGCALVAMFTTYIWIVNGDISGYVPFTFAVAALVLFSVAVIDGSVTAIDYEMEPPRH